MISLSVRPNLRVPATALWACIYATLASVLLRDYLKPGDAALWTGIGTCALIAGHAKQRSGSDAYGWVALGFSLFYFVLPIGTARFMAVGAAGCFLLERARGRQSWLLPLSLLIMSPVFANITGTVAFPLRLQLTELAGRLIAATGQDVRASGNLIRSGGADFSVDPACMGLHMLQCALLCGIAMIAAYGQRLRRRLGIGWQLAILCACLLLNLGSNLLRIVLLVLFGFAPETGMHELVGVICLVVYVLLPCGLLAGWLTRRFGKTGTAAAPAVPKRKGYLLHVAIALSLLGGGLAKPPKWDRTALLPRIPGYTATRAEAGVVRLEKGEVVVYLKDLQGFYGSEHHPLLCWTGSGYKFSHVGAKRISGLDAMCGTLEHEGRQYVSAWWYSSGTAHEFANAAWRWDALRSGRPYCIVNVTAPDATGVARCIEELKAAPGLDSWLARVGR